MKLHNKIALITGTAGGQGREAALLFAEEGAKVVGCDIKVEEDKETVDMVRAAGGKMVSMQSLDLGDSSQVKRWIEFAVRNYGGIDILYNNAGSAKFALIEDMTEDEWHSAIRNELDIVYLACHHAWPYLKSSGHGIIINAASMSGMVGQPIEVSANFAHAAAKGGVIALTRQLAIEGAPYNIRANSISPGLIETPATKWIFQNKEHLEAFLSRIPLNRAGKAEEIAKIALFLASDDSSYITGANIVADGGFTAQ